MFAALINHLWQSTIFAIVVALLILAFRKNRARVRYALWLAASLKFLVPFALLIALGTNLWITLAARKVSTGIAPPVVSQALVQAVQPISDTFFPTHAQPKKTNWLLISIVTAWALGFLAIARMRFRAWLRIRAALKSSQSFEIRHPEWREATRRTSLSFSVRSAPGLLEPGVVGLFRPTLLLPEGILQNLTPPQLEAVVAHELAHIRRRDNLTAALHMLVEAVFWFHPLVWWIGARLIEERERACDEAVLSLGNQPRDYAEAILNVCKLYVESPLACVSGVTGTSINTRIREILARRLGGDMQIEKKLLLAVAGLGALAIPVAVGMMIARPTHAQLGKTPALGHSQSPASAVAAEQVAPRPPGRSMFNSASTGDYVEALGTVTATSVVVSSQVDGQLSSVNFKEGTLVRQGQVLASLDVPDYNGALQKAQAQLANDQAQLDASRAQWANSTVPRQQAAIEQLQSTVKMDQADLHRLTLEISNGQIIAPLTGIAGFLQVDAGNFVHPGEALVVINQVQPISAVFKIEEDFIPRVRALQKDGASPTVELFDREGKTTMAVGHLSAIDNEIDATTGTVKVKAEFDNKDGTLFPNEFVNVRMYWEAH